MAFICLTFSANSQSANPSPFPCLRTLAVKNLGNNQSCGTVSGYQKTGTIVVSFSTALPASVQAPDITSLFNVDGNGNASTQIDAKFVFRGFGDTRQTAEYCYYTPNGNNALSNGSQVYYKATITYPSYDPSTCDVQNIPPPNTLPVSFGYFIASKASNGLLLKWATSTEMNNKGFWIQKQSGSVWTNIAFVNSKALNGNSDNEIVYTYTHNEVVKGIAQYRLQQVDFDGQTKLSEVRILKENTSTKDALVFPNPASKGSAVTIVLPDPQATYHIQVIDVAGRTIQDLQNSRNTQTLSQINKGQYFVRITDRQSGEAITERFVVQ
jgi:hypothetical protein